MKFSVCMKCNLTKERQRGSMIPLHKHINDINLSKQKKKSLFKPLVNTSTVVDSYTLAVECLIVSKCVLGSALIEIGLTITRKKKKIIKSM